jgi:hypothetical protein
VFTASANASNKVVYIKHIGNMFHINVLFRTTIYLFINEKKKQGKEERKMNEFKLTCFKNEKVNLSLLIAVAVLPMV